MSPRAKHSKEKLASISNKLDALPEVETSETLSNYQSIEHLRKPIKAAMKKGYTLEQIVEVLKEDGIDLKAQTLRNYLTKSGSKNKKTASGASGRSKTTSVTPTSSKVEQVKAHDNSKLIEMHPSPSADTSGFGAHLIRADQIDIDNE